MLMRFDPFRELDRFTQQALRGAGQPASWRWTRTGTTTGSGGTATAIEAEATAA